MRRGYSAIDGDNNATTSLDTISPEAQKQILLTQKEQDLKRLLSRNQEIVDRFGELEKQLVALKGKPDSQEKGEAIQAIGAEHDKLALLMQKIHETIRQIRREKKKIESAPIGYQNGFEYHG